VAGGVPAAHTVTVLRRRFLTAYAFLVALAAAGAASYVVVAWPSGAGPRCSEAIPAGQTVAAAWRTTELYVADVILARQPRCSSALASRSLRSRRVVRPFSTGYPPVAIARASHDPHVRQAVYMLSRRDLGLATIGPHGLQMTMLVGLAAPHAGRGAYDLVLVVENGSWRVDSVRRIAIVDD
jgi:hypothetical protein